MNTCRSAAGAAMLGGHIYVVGKLSNVYTCINMYIVGNLLAHFWQKSYMIPVTALLCLLFLEYACDMYMYMYIAMLHVYVFVQ